MLLLKFESLVSSQNRTRFLEAVTANLEPVRSEEGCLDYQLCERTEDSGGKRMVVLFQIWKSESTLKQHLESPRFNQFLHTLEISDYTPLAYVYRISEIRQALSIEEFLNGFTP